ncbi:hypothetical protein EV649_7859 [Kribbella sp. VKM Ac-2569]|uniref:hypothetical protein n=1 Tax=Kribbella sp. VKM Ac-2569 TaxID=2512220 RepID=UPI00102D1586|nr:hypothetical protein [Kribbella sp. VKM Ac-2569]RZT07928.1 hypothetical protein EV649_7859 [Kribbella sp. VKM Ac-2569]
MTEGHGVRRQPSKYDINLPRLDSRVLETNKRRIVAGRRQDGVELADRHRDLRIGDAYLVNDDSQVSLQRAVHTLAGYFKREFRYDYNQYPVARDGFDPREAWLWVADEYTNLRAVGAALFHQDRFKAPAGSERDWQMAWVLEFVWLHPYERGQGLLSGSWEGWRARHPGFVVEQPWSPAMEGFLERHPHVYYDGKATSDILARLRSR